jgi:DNA invertase Pin-like site-specific DNA recombinase
MLYLYARVSTDKQEHGKEAQVDRLMRWAEGQEVGGVFVDEDVSAHSTRLQDRPAGKQLWDRLESGDVVAATKMDRMFRRLADMASTIDAWKQLGIRLVLLDMDVDISTPHGRAFAGWSAVAAQLESELHGQRKREVYAHLKAAGVPYATIRPYGWSVATKPRKGRRPERYYVVNDDERGVARRINELREAEVPWEKITLDLFHDGVRQASGRPYSLCDVYYLVRAAKAGYPKIPRGAWRDPDCERRLTAGTDHALPI